MRSGTGEITDLTICRAVFAGWVFTYHVDLYARFSVLAGPAGGIIRRGYLGVDGFFLLSGLILARVHPGLGLSRAAAVRFWGKRLARIYPVHLAVIVLLAVVTAIGIGVGITPRDPGRFGLMALVENLLLIHGWGVADQLAWNYPSWSVSTEWAGYLLFPVLWFFVGGLKRGVAGLLGLLCLGVLAAVDLGSPHGLNLTFAYSLLRFFPEFILGMVTTRLLLAVQLPGVVLAGVGVAVMLISLLSAPDFCVVFGLWLVLAGFAANAGSGGLLQDFRLLRFLGVLSYAFYMSFATVELFLSQLCRHQGWEPAAHRLIYTASMTILTFLLALSLHHLVEKPVRRLADRRLNDPPPLAQRGLRL